MVCFVGNFFHDIDLVDDHKKLMGYIMGYLSILTGHRAVVLTNVTKENVKSAEVWHGGKRFQILVS